MGLNITLVDFNLENKLEKFCKKLPKALKYSYLTYSNNNIYLYIKSPNDNAYLSVEKKNYKDEVNEYFGDTAQYFNVRFNSLKLLALFLEHIDNQQAWIDTGGYNFHMYIPEYLEKVKTHPDWDWTRTTFWDGFPRYTDPLVFGLKLYPKDERTIVPIYPEMIKIPPGSFTFDCEENTRRYHITLEKSFALGKYPVSFAEYDRFCQATQRPFPQDLNWGRNCHPVIQVTWNAACAYCEWLNQRSSKHYRLPSELEWEYVTQLGLSESIYNKTIDTQENQPFPSWTKPVGGYGANSLGVYDLLSNIWEWTLDYDHDTCANMHLDGSPWQIAEFDKTLYPDFVEMERIARGGGGENKTKIESIKQRKAFISLRGYPCVGFRILEEIA